MSRTIALDPVVTRVDTALVATPTMLKTETIPLDPVCRKITEPQTVTPDIPSTG